MQALSTLYYGRVGKMKQAFGRGSLLMIFLLTTGCNSQTLFQSNFDATAVNQPPAPSQSVGTVTTQGSVRVQVIPGTNLKGVQFDPRSNPNDNTALRCELSVPQGNGTYVFSTAIYWPSNSGGTVTIWFDRPPGVISTGALSQDALSGNPKPEFMHLDLIGDRVRIDDDNSTTFGTFPRDQLFLVQVTLNINATPSAHILLSGAGASGEADRKIGPSFPTTQLQFGAVRISTVLSADVQTFYATTIVVSRQP
jgi:hypothetical protein